MGDREFDELLKRLESGPTRRGIVRGTLAGLGASLAALLRGGAADAKKKRRNDDEASASSVAGDLTPETITEAHIRDNWRLCEIPWVLQLYPQLCKKRRRRNNNNNNNNNNKGCGGRCKRDERCVNGRCRKRPVS